MQNFQVWFMEEINNRVGEIDIKPATSAKLPGIVINIKLNSTACKISL